MGLSFTAPLLHQVWGRDPSLGTRPPLWAIGLCLTVSHPVRLAPALGLPYAPMIHTLSSRLFASAIRFGSLPATRHGLVVAAAVFVVASVHAAATGDPFVGYDAHVYWSAAALDHPYAATIASGFGGAGGQFDYKYPPVLAQLLFVVHWVPWPVFLGAWTTLLLAAVSLQSGRLMLPMLVFPPVLGELWLGNLNLLIGLAIVVGFRWPAAWAVVVLTKMTPGIGLLWFAVRREWRELGIAVGVSSAVGAVSLAIAPDLWADFVAGLRTQVDVSLNSAGQAIPLPLPVRLIAAALLTAWGARAGRRWVVPIAAILAIPFSWWNVFSIALAVIPLTAPSAAPRIATVVAGRGDRPIGARPPVG